MNNTALRLFACAALALPASAAIAHHGWGWTEMEESRLSGTIDAISFTNPHMHIRLRAEDGLWSVDLSPPIVARNSGFGPDAARAGDRVILTGHRSRDPAQKAFKAETVTVNGKTYDVYPQRDKSLNPSG